MNTVYLIIHVCHTAPGSFVWAVLPDQKTLICLPTFYDYLLFSFPSFSPNFKKLALNLQNQCLVRVEIVIPIIIIKTLPMVLTGMKWSIE